MFGFRPVAAEMVVGGPRRVGPMTAASFYGSPALRCVSVHHPRLVHGEAARPVAADGGLYMATPVDPIFVLLPTLERAAHQVPPGRPQRPELGLPLPPEPPFPAAATKFMD